MLRHPAAKLLLAVAIGAALFYLGGYLGNRKAFNPYHFRIINLCGIAVILAVSLNLVNGVTGQFSIGHAGFMAVGAYAGASLTVFGQGSFLPALAKADFWTQQWVMLLALSTGGVVAAFAGWLVGLPSLRLRGDYLAIVTLGFGEIIRVAILNIAIVGGAAGFSGWDSPRGRITIPPLTTFFWIWAVAIFVIFFSRNLLRSTHGLAFFSVREDEVAAEAMGVPTTRIKVTAFVLSAFFAGQAGALFAHLDSFFKPDSFDFIRSIEIVTMVVLGGSGSISGSVVGAVLLTALPEFLRSLMSDLVKRKVISPNIPDLVRQLLYAVLLILLMLTRPQGLLGEREISLRRWLGRRRNASA
jgi:branched-chain amino acid transport system permease protein